VAILLVSLTYVYHNTRFRECKVEHTNFFLIKPIDALISKIYSCQETLHVSGSFSAHHQEFSTVHSVLVYVMQVC